MFVSDNKEFHTLDDMLNHYRKIKERRPLYLKVYDFIYYPVYRIYDKVRYILSKKYKLTREHREIGLTYWDRPIKSYDSFEAMYSLAWNTYPILVRFYRGVQYGVPTEFPLKNGAIDMDGWKRVINEMIYAFQEILHDDNSLSYEELSVLNKRVKKGLNLYAKYFRNLWD